MKSILIIIVSGGEQVAAMGFSATSRSHPCDVRTFMNDLVDIRFAIFKAYILSEINTMNAIDTNGAMFVDVFIL